MRRLWRPKGLRRSTRSAFSGNVERYRRLLLACALCVVPASFASANEVALPSEQSGPQSTNALSTLAQAPSNNDFSLSLGGAAWSGDFGSSSTTDIAAGLLSARYKAGDWRLSATLPYTRITTAGDIFLGIDATPLIVRPQTTALRRVNEGLGDLTLGVAYAVPTAPRLGVDLQLLGGLKIPTASAGSRVSTGQVDFSLGGEVSKTFGRVVPFASVVYRDFGNSPSLHLRDGVATSVGASYVFPNLVVANLTYDYARSASRFVRDADEIVPSLSYKFRRSAVRLSSYCSFGVSSGAPAISGGLSLSKSL